MSEQIISSFKGGKERNFCKYFLFKYLPSSKNFLHKQKSLAITYSHTTVHGTTIGSLRLNVRVRYVYVCFPQAYCHQAKYLPSEASLTRAPPTKCKLFDHLTNIVTPYISLKYFKHKSLSDH